MKKGYLMSLFLLLSFLFTTQTAYAQFYGPEFDLRYAYEDYRDMWDFLIFFAIFIGLVRAALVKRFGEDPGARTMYLALGIAFAWGAVYAGLSIGAIAERWRDVANVAWPLLLLLFIGGLYNLIKVIFKGIKWHYNFLISFVVTILIFGSFFGRDIDVILPYQVIGYIWWLAVLVIVILLAWFIARFFRIGGAGFGKRKEKEQEFRYKEEGGKKGWWGRRKEKKGELKGEEKERLRAYISELEQQMNKHIVIETGLLTNLRYSIRNADFGKEPLESFNKIIESVDKLVYLAENFSKYMPSLDYWFKQIMRWKVKYVSIEELRNLNIFYKNKLKYTLKKELDDTKKLRERGVGDLMRICARIEDTKTKRDKYAKKVISEIRISLK